MIIDPYRFASSAPAANAIHVGGKLDAGSLTMAHSIAGVPFGIPASNRLVVIAVSILSDISIDQTISSATIAGVAATVHGQTFYENLTISKVGIAFISAVVPAGTSGTVAVNFSIPTRIFLSATRVIGLTSFAPVDFAASGFNADSVTVNCDVQEGGVVIGASHLRTSVPVACGGFPEDYATTWATNRWAVGGCLNVTATQSNRALNLVKISGVGTPAGSLAGISFR